MVCGLIVTLEAINKSLEMIFGLKVHVRHPSGHTGVAVRVIDVFCERY